MLVSGGGDLPRWLHPFPRRHLRRRPELTTEPRSQPHILMTPIGDLSHPFSDIHSTGGADKGQTSKSRWGERSRRNPGPWRRGPRRRQHGRGGATQRNSLQQCIREREMGPLPARGAMRLITRKSSLAGVELPSSPVDPKCKACPRVPHRPHGPSPEGEVLLPGVRGVVCHIDAPCIAHSFDVERGAGLTLRVYR